MEITPSSSLHIFISYASEQLATAEQVFLALSTSGHTVFFDRTMLMPGQEFDRAILEAIRASDLMIFLISPESVRESTYARTELRFARETWPNPAGSVLPVLVAPVDFSDIPVYLKAVTILIPTGNIPAEVSAAVHDLAKGGRPKPSGVNQDLVIKAISAQTKQLERSHRLAEIDRNWDLKKLGFASTGLPTNRVFARLMPLPPIIMSIVMTIVMTVVVPSFIPFWFAFVPLLFGAFGALSLYFLGNRFCIAEDDYLRTRNLALHDES